MCIGIHVKHS